MLTVLVVACCVIAAANLVATAFLLIQETGLHEKARTELAMVRKRLVDAEDVLLARLRSLEGEVRAAQHLVESGRGDFRELREELTKPRVPEPWEKLIGTSFLPTEEHQATLERRLAQSEDHAIDVNGQARFSSRPSDPSNPNSRRVASTQRVPPSSRG